MILARLDGQFLLLTLLGLVFDNQLGIYDLKCHHKKDQATRYLLP